MKRNEMIYQFQMLKVILKQWNVKRQKKSSKCWKIHYCKAWKRDLLGWRTLEHDQIYLGIDIARSDRSVFKGITNQIHVKTYFEEEKAFNDTINVNFLIKMAVVMTHIKVRQSLSSCFSNGESQPYNCMTYLSSTQPNKKVSGN